MIIPLCCLPLYIFQIQVQVASFKFWRMSLFTSLRHPPIWILFCKSWSFNLDILSWDERNNFPLSLQFRSLPNMFSPFSNLIGILEIIAFSSLWSSIGRHILLQSSLSVWWHSNTEKTMMPESRIHWTKLEISVPGTARSTPVAPFTFSMSLYYAKILYYAKKAPFWFSRDGRHIQDALLSLIHTLSYSLFLFSKRSHTGPGRLNALAINA